MENKICTEIRRLENSIEVDICARMMVNSEPWITLGLSYEAAERALTVPTKEVYVAVAENEVIGFIALNMHGGFIGYIHILCVAPLWRNRGIGRKLLAFAEERILSATPNVFVCVSSFNENAQRFYQSIGYETVGELKDYIVSGYSEILLRKTISSLKEFRNRNVPF